MCVAAWGVTFVLILVLGGLFGTMLANVLKLQQVGAANWLMVVGVSYPFIIVIGVVSLLIATLATIGVFVRSRAASLNEIHLRLAALEQMLTARGDGD